MSSSAFFTDIPSRMPRSSAHVVNVDYTTAGQDVWIYAPGSVSNDEAKEQYPDGWKSPKPYIRIVKDPSA